MTVEIIICVNQKNKTSFRVDFDSLMTSMAIFFTSVALLPSKITEKTVKTVILSLLNNTKKFTNFIQNHTKNLLIHFEWLVFKHFLKIQLREVITVIFMISYGALSRFHLFWNVLQFDISSSAYDIVCDCKPAFFR